MPLLMLRIDTMHSPIYQPNLAKSIYLWGVHVFILDPLIWMAQNLHDVIAFIFILQNLKINIIKYSISSWVILPILDKCVQFGWKYVELSICGFITPIIVIILAFLKYWKREDYISKLDMPKSITYLIKHLQLSGTWLDMTPTTDTRLIRG